MLILIIVMTCLLESMGVVDIPNIKLLKKDAKKFQKKLSKLFCENDDLIAKLNERSEERRVGKEC